MNEMGQRIGNSDFVQYPAFSTNQIKQEPELPLALEETRQDIRDQPPESKSHLIVRYRFNVTLHQHLASEQRKGNPSANRQFQGTPEPGIDLHQFEDPISGIVFELYLSRAMPPKLSKKCNCLFLDLRFSGGLAFDASSSARRIHEKTLLGQNGSGFSVIEESANIMDLARYEFLHERIAEIKVRVGRLRIGCV